MTYKEFNEALVWTGAFILLFEGLALFIPRPNVWPVWLFASAMTTLVYLFYLFTIGKIK